MQIPKLSLAYGALIVATAMIMKYLDVSDGIALIGTIGLSVIALVHMRATGCRTCGSAS